MNREVRKDGGVEMGEEGAGWGVGGATRSSLVSDSRLTGPINDMTSLTTLSDRLAGRKSERIGKKEEKLILDQEKVFSLSDFSAMETAR